MRGKEKEIVVCGRIELRNTVCIISGNRRTMGEYVE